MKHFYSTLPFRRWFHPAVNAMEAIAFGLLLVVSFLILLVALSLLKARWPSPDTRWLILDIALVAFASGLSIMRLRVVFHRIVSFLFRPFLNALLSSTFSLRSLFLVVLVIAAFVAFLLPAIQGVWQGVSIQLQLRQDLNGQVEKDELGRIYKIRCSTGGSQLLRSMAGLKSVRVLDLEFADITDDDLAYVATLTGLESLNVAWTPITDDGLRWIKGLTNLKRLELYNTQVSNNGLSSLSKLKRLEYLSLEGTQVTDKGLNQFTGFPALAELHLNRLPITDIGLAHLSDMKRLRELELNGTDVSDAGLVHLASLGLLRLDLYRTRVTAQGVERLCRSRPECNIHFSPSDPKRQ